jgi:hypothetical protein
MEVLPDNLAKVFAGKLDLAKPDRVAAGEFGTRRYVGYQTDNAPHCWHKRSHHARTSATD